jgi:hypothetical protein
VHACSGRTLCPPGVRQVTNPAIGKVDFDEDSYEVRGYTAYKGDLLATYRDLLQAALDG